MKREIIIKIAEKLEKEKMKKDIKVLKDKVKILENGKKPKTLFEQEWEKNKKEAFED